MLFYEQQYVIEFQQKEIDRRAKESWRFSQDPKMGKSKKQIKHQSAQPCCVCQCES